MVTDGLDDLRKRLVDYYQEGARIAKWRAVITIGDGIPTQERYEVNAHALARYAALCQEVSIVPIVEPEVLMDGTCTPAVGSKPIYLPLKSRQTTSPAELRQ